MPAARRNGGSLARGRAKCNHGLNFGVAISGEIMFGGGEAVA